MNTVDWELLELVAVQEDLMEEDYYWVVVQSVAEPLDTVVEHIVVLLVVGTVEKDIVVLLVVDIVVLLVVGEDIVALLVVGEGIVVLLVGIVVLLV